MRSNKIIDHIMESVPFESKIWCEPTGLGCCCMGCVNNETDLSKEEFDAWKSKHNYCDHCKRHD